MKNFIVWLLPAALLLGFVAIGGGYLVSRPQFNEKLDPASLSSSAIAPPQQALTLARYRQDGKLRLMLVTRHENDQVRGVTLESSDADPLRLFRERGYEALAAAAGSTANVQVPVSALETPFDGREANIGIGANYPEHARESGLEEQPFVFPKLALPTRHDSTVQRAPSVLLDYEAELGLVALDDIPPPGTLPQYMGLVLCNELTDRWALVRNFKRGAEMGTTGFVEGKSREGFAVLGPLLVIPRDLPSFYPRIELRLHLNGHLRQHERASSMAWDAQAVLREIFARGAWRFANHGGVTPLLAGDGSIPAGSVIFSGTPAGVIFKPLNLANPWVYLQPGDEVVIQGSYLGRIHNRIVD